MAFSEILSQKCTIIHYTDDAVLVSMVYGFKPSTVLFKATSELCTMYHTLKSVKKTQLCFCHQVNKTLVYWLPW
jgi:hypothetical protein